NADIFELHPRRDRCPVSSRVQNSCYLNARSIARNHDNSQRFLSILLRVGPTNRIEMTIPAVPAGTIRGVVLLTVDHPFIAFEGGEGLDTKPRIRGIEICTTCHLGEGQRAQQRSVFDEIRKETPLLLIRPKHDDGLDAKASSKHRARDVDVDD